MDGLCTEDARDKLGVRDMASIRSSVPFPVAVEVDAADIPLLKRAQSDEASPTR